MLAVFLFDSGAAHHGLAPLFVITVVGNRTAKGLYRPINAAVEDRGPQCLVLIQCEANAFLAWQGLSVFFVKLCELLGGRWKQEIHVLW